MSCMSCVVDNFFGMIFFYVLLFASNCERKRRGNHIIMHVKIVFPFLFSFLFFSDVSDIGGGITFFYFFFSLYLAFFLLLLNPLLLFFSSFFHLFPFFYTCYTRKKTKTNWKTSVC